MCGRYSLTTPAEAVRRLLRYPERPNLMARANVAPSQDVAAVRLAPDVATSDEDKSPRSNAPVLESPDEDNAAGRRFVWLRWGLIPSWAKDAAIGNRMINARAESVAEKPAFRAAFRQRRCLIAADGFYEWRGEAGQKQPYRVALADGGPFAFAGLWERWTKGADGAPVESCTIVTTEANALLKPIHPRMPVILDPGDFDAWLDPATPGPEAQALLRPFPADRLTAYRVSRKINAVANDDPSLIAPIDGPAQETDPTPRLL